MTQETFSPLSGNGFPPRARKGEFSVPSRIQLAASELIGRAQQHPGSVGNGDPVETSKAVVNSDDHALGTLQIDFKYKEDFSGLTGAGDRSTYIKHDPDTGHTVLSGSYIEPRESSSEKRPSHQIRAQRVIVSPDGTLKGTEKVSVRNETYRPAERQMNMVTASVEGDLSEIEAAQAAVRVLKETRSATSRVKAGTKTRTEKTDQKV